jgi:membrane protein implicated in regulation of membrane protease activity
MVVAWLVLGVILLAFEMRHFAFYALFGALGCLAASITALFVPFIPVQVVVAAAVAAVGIVAVRPMMSRRFNAHEDHGPLGRGVAGTLVGEEVMTLDAVGDTHAPGHVRLAGERWLATSGSGTPIPQGARVLVTAVAGTTLVVWPVDGVVAPLPIPESTPRPASEPTSSPTPPGPTSAPSPRPTPEPTSSPTDEGDTDDRSTKPLPDGADKEPS